MTRLVHPAIDHAGSRIAFSSNVSNSFAVLNLDDLWNNRTFENWHCGRLAEVLGDLLSYRYRLVRGQRVNTEDVFVPRRATDARGWSDQPLIPKELQDQSTARSLCVQFDERKEGIMVSFACLSRSPSVSISLEMIILSDRKWQWVNLNHGSLLLSGSRSLMERIPKAGSKNHRWEHSQQSVDSEWRDTSPAR